jgi:deoxyribose-phosphate aldolase
MSNPGIALDLQWVESARINKSMVEKRAAEIPTRRTVKKKWQVAWLLRAIQCIDLTTLSGDDTPSNVQRLCAKARRPVQPDLMKLIGIESITTGAVCVYPNRVADAGTTHTQLQPQQYSNRPEPLLIG